MRAAAAASSNLVTRTRKKPDFRRNQAFFIRTYRDGKELHPPCAQIPGLSKPVSRIFFGKAIRPMQTGRDANALLDAPGQKGYLCA